jgi:hypothetical protein
MHQYDGRLRATFIRQALATNLDFKVGSIEAFPRKTNDVEIEIVTAIVATRNSLTYLMSIMRRCQKQQFWILFDSELPA